MGNAEEYEASIRVVKKATKEDAERLNIEIGEEFTIIPEPKNKTELLERFENLHAQRLFEAQLRLFKRKYGDPSKKVIEDELKELNTFISKASQLSTTETFKNKYIGDTHLRDLHELSRLTNGYYRNPNKPFSAFGYFNNNAPLVYGKYILFKEWLQNELNEYKSKTKLTENFIEQLRTHYGIMNWIFEDERIEIVPKEFTHERLKRNNPIGENILKFYYLPTSRFFSDKEYQKMVDYGYVGKKDATLDPYPFIMYGAYFGRIDLYTKLAFTTLNDKKPYLNGNNTLEYLEDYIPYFKEYSHGFKEGYNNFEAKCIEPFLPMFADKRDFATKVHEFLTKRIMFEHDWLNNHSGFTTEHANEPTGGKIINAFEDGQKQGYFYKAWTIVFSNSQLFESLFFETMEERHQSGKKNYDSQQSQQSNENNPVRAKAKHTHIFNNNAFDVWQSMYDSFGITESSRTDVKFMYEEMKKDGLIYNTVNQKTFLDWISQTYEIVIHKTSNYSKTPKRISIYSNAKQLYKR
mgnify:CR=1 FL=1|tara:strand:- start:22846 stop:24408 length:1563 start_codon:yes stop_codon:yes gene_type:complete